MRVMLAALIKLLSPSPESFSDGSMPLVVGILRCFALPDSHIGSFGLLRASSEQQQQQSSPECRSQCFALSLAHPHNSASTSSSVCQKCLVSYQVTRMMTKLKLRNTIYYNPKSYWDSPFRHEGSGRRACSADPTNLVEAALTVEPNGSCLELLVETTMTRSIQ